MTRLPVVITPFIWGVAAGIVIGVVLMLTVRYILAETRRGGME